jgi:hypothetical protein
MSYEPANLKDIERQYKARATMKRMLGIPSDNPNLLAQIEFLNKKVADLQRELDEYKKMMDLIKQIAALVKIDISDPRIGSLVVPRGDQLVSLKEILRQSLTDFLTNPLIQTNEPNPPDRQV